nr:TonB-dependent receptor [uncultured Carboxylicivirga sp.]
MNFKYILLVLIACAISVGSFSQEKKKTREEVLNMTMEEMSSLPLEELMDLMDIVGVSSLEELYDLLLNKDVTSASKKEESLFDSPLSTTVLSKEEILSSGATSVEEALRLVPGVVVREKANGVYDVQIRGGQNMPMNNMLIYTENTTTLVMIDGRPVFNYGMGGILWETLPVSLGELDRIEVVRGPSSALYGPNAVNGVINLITSRVNDDTPVVSANFQGGSQKTYIGDFNLRKRFNDIISGGLSYYYENRDRNTDKIYAIADDAFLDLETYGGRNASEGWSNDIVSELFFDSERSKRKMGINGYLDMNFNSDVSVNLTGGYSDAEAISSTFGDNPTPYNQRCSYGYFVNMASSIYGFNLQASTNHVLQDFNKGHKGWVQATEQYNASLDYLLSFNKLGIRPGISYQSVYYDDRDHIDNIGDGYFNDRVALRNYAASARFDYTPTEKLRLVAALRYEKYNVPDQWKPSYQFIGSYKINDNNLFRVVYSRANQSTFMINAFSNYTWNRDGLGSPEYVHFAGSDDPSLMTMDMIEIGFRTRPSKRVLIDIEAFYNSASDFSALMPDSMRSVTFMGDNTLDYANGEYTKTTLYTSHRSLDIESKQMGVSLSADMVVSEKLQLKAHMTFQQTKVTDLMDLSRNQVAYMQVSQYQGQMTDDITAFLTYMATGGLAGSPIPPQNAYSSDLQQDKSEFIDMDNEAIPSFWGSLGVTYKPVKKLDISAQGYYYSNSSMYTQYDNDSSRPANPEYTGEIDGKFILNAKVNYKLTDQINVFVNGRNILNNDKQEFMFMDDIGGIYLAGFNISL